MQDQNQPTVPQNEPTSKKPNLLYDWWEEMYPRDFLMTFKNYFFNHKKFFDEIFNEKWDDKVKPMAFLLTALALTFVVSSLSPWGFKDQPEWHEVYLNLTETEQDEFLQVLDLQHILDIEDPDAQNESANISLDSLIGGKPPYYAKDLEKFFEDNNNKTLAARAEYTDLKYSSDNELGDVTLSFTLNLILIIFILYWLVTHRFFKPNDRTSRETVMVWMYAMGMIYFFVYIPIIAFSEAEGTWGNIVMGLILLMFLIITYKIFAIFRYTHNTGFFGLIKVYFFTGFVIILFGIPLLFMRKKKKALVKSS